MRSLLDIGWGSEGIVKKVGSHGALRRHLLDLGITRGTKIKMIKPAPLGDPIEICVHGYKLSLRKSEAREIEVLSKEEEKYVFSLNSKNSLSGTVNNFLSFPILNSKKETNKPFRAALVGNPNCGKTTLFNQLTGSYQYVGNWPGVTVERKEGRIKNLSDKIDLIDLPGVYSLSPYSPEEIVTRNYILSEMPDVIINIVDSTNLERNLYLTTQLLELEYKMILVLNMTDLLKNHGKEIDTKKLEKRLGIPVICISAGKNKGIDKLLEELSLLVKKNNLTRQTDRFYSSEVEDSIIKIDKIINRGSKYVYNSRFKAVKAFEGDKLILRSYNLSNEALAQINKIRESVSSSQDKEKDIIIPDERYSYIQSLCRDVVRDTSAKLKLSFSDMIDKVATGKFTAIPCFLLLMMIIFYLTFGPLGNYLKELCEEFLNLQMTNTVRRILNYIGVSPWVKSLLLDAVIKGVGAVISFLPQVLLLFTLLSFLEDCGYMSRATFIMDKPMRKIGLSGRAFVPLIMGFGCSVPAVMGTKILENKKDKNLTIFLIPFISCSAKMPIYLLFASVFFPKYQAIVIFSFYLFGIICACFTAYIFKDTLFKGSESHFIMEMPDYKLPSLKNVRLSIWDKTKDFIERAGTIILLATIVVWCLQYFGMNLHHVEDNSQSILAHMGKLISPLFKLCGFDDWRVCVSLLTGVMAKESIVSTLSVLYGPGAEFIGSLSSTFNWINAISFLVFALLYTPCVAAVSAIYKEFGDKKLAVASIIYQLVFAYFCSAFVYQIITLVSNLAK